MCAAVYQLAQPQITVTRVHQKHVRPLLVILPYHVIGEETFAATTRPQNKFVAIGRNTFFHGQV